MQLGTRKLLDRSFSSIGILSIVLMSLALIVLLGPIFVRGIEAFVFRGTVEHRRYLLERLERGDRDEVEAGIARASQARQPIYDMIAAFEEEVAGMKFMERREWKGPLEDLKDRVRTLIGPFPDETEPVMRRDQYGQTRWDRAQVKLHDLLYVTVWDASDPTKMATKTYEPRVEKYRDTPAEPLFSYVEENLESMLLPEWTFYWGFITDEPDDANMFGGIWPAVLGTLYLTVGAMLIAGPMGIISAIYLTEYAGQTRFVSVLRSCISTLAGVPSIVFGLFGLAFFINSLHVSESKSVLAGSLTLAFLVLPTVIRASEEAIKAVPQTYKEAALSLGASKWRTVFTVVLPAALPGVLTSIIISMGRAAGETAPIIFTAAVSIGRPVKLWEVFSQPTPALPWNIYNLCTEHEAVDEIRHVQYGMVLTLIVMVLILNVTAIILRARISKKLRG